MADPRMFDYYEPGKDSIDDILDYSKLHKYKRIKDPDIKTENEKIKKTRITNQII